MRITGLSCVAVILLSVRLAGPAQTGAVQVEKLRCEYRTNPLGIDVTEPRLSWVLTPADPNARGVKQSAYQILVASSPENLSAGKGDLWDSGKVSSDESTHVVYRGKPLDSGVRAWWNVRVWDQDGRPSGWSAPAFWSMGLLKPQDWKANWIGRDEEGLYKHPSSPYWNLAKARWIWYPSGEPATAAPAGTGHFRMEFSVPAGRKIRKALFVMGADSRFEVFLNGERTGKGSSVRMPEVIDATGAVREGKNLVAVEATGPSGSKPAGLIGAIRVEFDQGEPFLVITDGNWRASEKSLEGWQRIGFDDSQWKPVKDLGPCGMAPWGEVGFIEERVLPARMLRKEFQIAKAVRRATAYVTGLGLFELYLNGEKVGDHVLSPGLTDYDKRVLYVTFDVTRQVAAGRNAVGLMLGNGRYYAPRERAPIFSRTYGYPKALLQLEIEHADGTTATIVTDETWRLTTSGPIRANNEYDGEEYDARMELKGWARAGFDDSQWEAARIVSAPRGALAAQMAEPLRVTKTLRPVKMMPLRPGVYIFDMGQNIVGWCRLKVSGPKAATVSLRHAETLRQDGNLYVANLRSARAANLYTLKGGGAEVWEPRFTYHGFRYVEVSGFPGKPTLDSIEGRVVHDDMASAGDFSSSNDLLNKIHQNIVWGIRGNYRSIPTDCPQRDERQGWLGDRSMVSRSESYMFDVAAFYTKWMTDLADSQRDNGSIPDVAPAYWVMYTNDVTWPSTFLFVPEMLYRQYGDLRVIERHYPSMKKWIDFMRGFLKDDLMPRDTYGDWCVPPESPELIHSKDPARKTDGTLIGSAYFYHLLRVMARYATLLGKAQDASEFDDLAGRMRAAFHKKFFRAESRFYSNGTQTSSILPLAFGMTASENRGSVFDALIRKIEQESRGHIGTGLVGAQWLMRTLSDHGRVDVAYQIASQRDYPGWGYMIGKGATTIWELWNGDTADPAMNSGNHVMQIGDLGVWLYEYLAGVRPDMEKPGFKHVVFRPYPAGDLSFVKASHNSMYGMIASSWKRAGGRFHLEITVPPNTSATVYVPATSPEAVKESGQAASSAGGVKFVRMEAGTAVYDVGSGRYSFTSEM